MQFFIFVVVENSILGNPYSDYLEIFWFNVFDNQKMQNIARIWVYLSKNKHKQSWQMSDTRLSQVLDKNLFLQCQILLPHLDKQVDRQEARQFFRPKSGGAFNKVIQDVELLDLQNGKCKLLWYLINIWQMFNLATDSTSARPYLHPTDFFSASKSRCLTMQPPLTSMASKTTSASIF